MVPWVNYFKRAKQGSKLLKGSVKSLWKLNPMDIIKEIREVVGDNVTDIFKTASEVFDTIGNMAGVGGWATSHVPLISSLGVFGKTVQNAAELLSKGTKSLGKIGNVISGKPTKMESHWYDTFKPW